MDEVLPELRRALDAPITDAGQSRELLHLVGDLQTSRKLGLQGGSFALEDIMGGLLGHATGTGDVSAAEFARWRLLVRLDDTVADRVAREAVDALRSPAGDTSPAVQLVRAEPFEQRLAVGDLVMRHTAGVAERVRERDEQLLGLGRLHHRLSSHRSILCHQVTSISHLTSYIVPSTLPM